METVNGFGENAAQLLKTIYGFCENHAEFLKPINGFVKNWPENAETTSGLPRKRIWVPKPLTFLAVTALSC